MYQSLVHILHKWGPFYHPGVYCQIITCCPILLLVSEKNHPLRGPEWQGAPSQLVIEGYVSQFATQYCPQGEQPICKDGWGLDHGYLHIMSSPRCWACAGAGGVWAYGLHRWPFHMKHLNQTSVGKGKGKTCWTECHCGGVIELHCKYCHPNGFWRTGVKPLDPWV